ncbi:unnamed protein product [Cylicostephanus goldi]|uniref:G-protein coupled receptors family 1 profile domain-containing protein n=1 Tax=Cylicostephanus goldi TaxID=71465 RepID=A0A3P6RL68_CYLGO|nr:unnamed protein product [Cylicostephanus goldi]
MNIWVIGIVFKVIPCILLMILSFGLVDKIRQAERHRRKLTNVSLNNPNSIDGTSHPKKKSYRSDRTTTVLVVILIVFLITELPQGVISILCAVYTADVHKYLYFNLGDILDLLSLMNSSVNFVLYCIMSSRYRQTFWMVVLPASAQS